MPRTDAAPLRARFDSPFPPQVAFCCLGEGDAAVDQLAPAERALLGPGAAPRRMREFALGRASARAALAVLGFAPEQAAAPVILRAEGRAPRWPAGVVGAISHAAGLAVAAVARQAEYRGIGTDLERVREPSPALARRILRAEEVAALADAPLAARGRVFTLAFSAKESVYKALNPLTGRYLGFQDVRVTFGAGAHDATAGDIRWRLCGGCGGDFPPGYEGVGRFAAAGALVLTAVWIGTAPK